MSPLLIDSGASLLGLKLALSSKQTRPGSESFGTTVESDEPGGQPVRSQIFNGKLIYF